MSAVKRRDSISVSIVVRIGDRVMTVSDKSPLTLSGDRRRWRGQIAGHVSAQAEAISQRFAVTDLSTAEVAS